MDIQLIMLGTGSAFAKKYFNNNAVVTCAGYTLLIDCGITAPLAMHQIGLSPDQLNGIFISHIHADHIGGLEEIAFRLLYVHGGKKIDLFVPEPLVEPLWEHSLKGGLENQSEQKTSLDSYFHVHPVEIGVKTDVAPGFTIEAIPTKHIPGKFSCGLMLADTLFYSADSRFDRELIDAIASRPNCRYILHDCQLTPPGTVHATLNQLLTLPEDIQKKIYLMHYGDDMENYIGKTGAMTFLRQHEVYRFY